MDQKSQTNARDFSQSQHFPGTGTSRFSLFLRLSHWMAQLPLLRFAGLLALIVSLPGLASRIWSGAKIHPVSRAWRLAPYVLGDWALLAALPRAGRSFGSPQPPTLLMAAMRALASLLPRPLDLWAQTLGTFLALYGFWLEPHRVGLTHETLRTHKLAAGPPLRIMHLGDLHIERLTDRERQVTALVRETRPDLILFSGDLLNLSNVHDPEAWEEARDLLRQLEAPLGVYAVTGSPPVDPPEVFARVLDGLPIRWLRDERVRLRHNGHEVDLVGVTCTHRPHLDGPRLNQILDGNERLTILLYHTPDLAPVASAAGVDLQLSGHTHGGQVRLPFYGALFTSSLYGKRFEMGRRQVGGLTLYVTRGIGLEGAGAPRVRFLCPPEVTLWEIKGTARGETPKI